MANFPVRSFAGGMTDFPVGADANQFELADNLCINEYGDLVQRPGLDLAASATLADGSANLLMPQYYGTGTGKTFTLLRVGSNAYYYNGVSYTQVTGFQATATAAQAMAGTTWNEHTFITNENMVRSDKIFNTSGALVSYTAGLPPPAAAGFTATGAGATTYIYALVYKHTYTIGDTTYVDRGRPYLKSFGSLSDTPASGNITLGSFPTLANGTGENYHVSGTGRVVIEVYRTAANGQVLYYVGEVNNGTAGYTDSTADATLITAGVTLYTTGGVLENDLPPKCKYVHATGDFTYWAHGYEVSVTGADGVLYPQRLWQSKRGDPDSVPASFYADIEEPITAISSIKSVPIVFGANSVYRLDGTFDNLGRGGLTPKKISDGVGCVGHLSVVQTLDGLFFASGDGFCFTDGYKVVALSSDQFKTYYLRHVQTARQKSQMYGCFDATNKRILWAARDSEGDTEDTNNKIFCLHMPSKRFTTWSSGYRGEGIKYEEDNCICNPSYLGRVSFIMDDTSDIDVGDYVQAVHLGGGVYSEIVNQLVVDVGEVSGDKFIQIVDCGQEDAAGPYATQYYTIRVIDGSETHAAWYGSFQPRALLYANGIVYQSDFRGRLFEYNPDATSDFFPAYYGGVSNERFGRLAVQTHYAGPALDLGTTDYRKWVNSVCIKLRPRTDIETAVCITPYGENDDDRNEREMREIFELAMPEWGSLDYGDPDLYRRRQKIIDVIRRFPKGGLRCMYKQLHLRNAWVNIYASDQYETGEIIEAADGYKTMQIGEPLPEYPMHYYVYFSTDNYVQGYRIGAKVNLTDLTQFHFFDIAGTAPADNTTGIEWVIRGYPVEGYLNLIEYSYNYEVMGASQGPYNGTTGGNNE